ncbi:hypothetical protein BGZ75_006123 [Mortierella antarctica]|nr:hypothetical protein BGZ75_006123 [Mortierella antarctica]
MEQALAASTPQKRFGEVDGVAAAVSFLAHNESRWVNGQTIPVSGVAIVTGASRGIGRAIALRLAKDGFNIVINDLSRAAETQEAIEDIEAFHPTLSSKKQLPVRSIAVQGDTSKIADGRRLLDETITAFGRLDILVFNAAWAKQASIRELDEELFAKAIDTNVKGPLFLSKMAQPYLEKAQREGDAVKDGGSPLGGSRIISSTLATMSDALDRMLLYSISKGGLDQITRVLARDPDFGGKGINVNAVAPGPVDTDSLKDLPPYMLSVLANSSPQKRLGRVDDIADVVSFLASNDSRWVNGHTINASGASSV